MCGRVEGKKGRAREEGYFVVVTVSLSHQVVLVLECFSPQILQVDIATLITGYDNYFHATHGGRGRVGA